MKTTTDKQAHRKKVERYYRCGVASIMLNILYSFISNCGLMDMPMFKILGLGVILTGIYFGAVALMLMPYVFKHD